MARAAFNQVPAYVLSILVAAAMTACGGGDGGGGAGAVTLLAPGGDVELGTSTPGIVQIRYLETGWGAGATTDLFADRDGNLGTTDDQVVIEAGRPARPGEEQSVAWDVLGAPPGLYRIVGRTTAGQSKAVGEASGRVLVNAAPTISFLSPATDLTVSRGGSVEIRYVDDDPDDVALSWLSVDPDDLADGQGEAFVIAGLRSEDNGLEHVVRWDTSGVRAGQYALVGDSWDGTNEPATAVAAGRVIVEDVGYARIPVLSSSFLSVYEDCGYAEQSSFTGTVTLRPGTSEETQLTAVGLSDGYLGRYAPDGALLWATSVGGTGNDFPKGVATLPGGACVALFDIRNLTFFGSTEYRGHVLMRYGSTGTFDWATTAIPYQQGSPSALVGCPDGGCCVIGDLSGSATVVFGAGEAQETFLDPAMGRSFIARYESSGALRWVRQSNLSLFSSVGQVGLAAASDNAVLVSGNFSDGAVVGLGATGEATLATLAPGGVDGYVARFAMDGAVLWVRTFGGTGATFPGARVAACSDGGVAVSGAAEPGCVFDAGGINETILSDVETLFVARYDSNGVFGWVRRLDGGNSASLPAAPVIHAGDQGSVLVSTNVTPILRVGVGAVDARTIVSAFGGHVGGVARFEANGRLRWAYPVGESAGTALGLLRGVAADGTFLVAGDCQENLVLGVDGTRREVVPASSTAWAHFVARFNTDGGF